MSGTRLYIVEPPGSANCPPSHPGGCVNSGLYDPQRFPSTNCGDARQFDGIHALFDHCSLHQEAPMQVFSAAEAARYCSTGSSTMPVGLVPAGGNPGGCCGGPGTGTPPIVVPVPGAPPIVSGGPPTPSNTGPTTTAPTTAGGGLLEWFQNFFNPSGTPAEPGSPATFMGFFTSPVGIIVAFVLIFLFVNGRAGK